MLQPRSSIQLRTTSGQRVQVGDVAITPRSRALLVRFPFGGLVWNHPAGVLVERDGRAENIPIVDITRLVQFSLLGLAVVMSSLAWTRSSRRKE